MRKEPCRSGVEQDVVYAKRYYCFAQRPGVSKKIKRILNKRFRKRNKVKLNETTKEN